MSLRAIQHETCGQAGSAISDNPRVVLWRRLKRGQVGNDRTKESGEKFCEGNGMRPSVDLELCTDIRIIALYWVVAEHNGETYL